MHNNTTRKVKIKWQWVGWNQVCFERRKKWGEWKENWPVSAENRVISSMAVRNRGLLPFRASKCCWNKRRAKQSYTNCLRQKKEAWRDKGTDSARLGHGYIVIEQAKTRHTIPSAAVSCAVWLQSSRWTSVEKRSSFSLWSISLATPVGLHPRRALDRQAHNGILRCASCPCPPLCIGVSNKESEKWQELTYQRQSGQGGWMASRASWQVDLSWAFSRAFWGRDPFGELLETFWLQ